LSLTPKAFDRKSATVRGLATALPAALVVGGGRVGRLDAVRKAEAAYFGPMRMVDPRGRDRAHLRGQCVAELAPSSAFAIHLSKTGCHDVVPAARL
jgi:hypothetical protein